MCIRDSIITASSDDLVDLKRARSAGTILHLENRLAPFLAGVNDGCLEVGGDIILEARAQPPRSLGRQMGLDEASAKAGGKAVERAGAVSYTHLDVYKRQAKERWRQPAEIP